MAEPTLVKRPSLAVRRAALIEAAALQRGVIAHELQRWQAPLALTDQGLGVLRRIRQHPHLLVAGVVLLVVWRPQGVGKWLQRGWVAWQGVQRMKLKFDKP